MNDSDEIDLLAFEILSVLALVAMFTHHPVLGVASWIGGTLAGLKILWRRWKG